MDSRNLQKFPNIVADNRTWIQIRYLQHMMLVHCFGTSCLVTLVWNIEFVNVLPFYVLLSLMFTSIIYITFLGRCS